MSDQRIAIITGGASGIGLEVARRIVPKGWVLHIFDLNEKAGADVAKELSATSPTTFHKVDVSSWASLSAAFETVYQTAKRIDFVFANAGVFESENFYEAHDCDGPPPEPKWPGVDVNLKGAINTTYLAQHYFRKGGRKEGVLVYTASCVGLYPSEHAPRYAATKAGVLNLMRAVSPAFFSKYGVRVSAVLPGAVKTNFLAGNEWPPYPDNHFTPVSRIADAVEQLVEGGAMEDAWGEKVAAGQTYGLAVEVNTDKFYFRKQAEWCDDVMKAVMGEVTVDKAGK